MSFLGAHARGPWCLLAAAFAALPACSGAGTDLNALDNASAPEGGVKVEGGSDTQSVTIVDPFSGAPSFQGGQAGDNAGHALDATHAACTRSGCHTSGSDEADPFLLGGIVYKDYYAMMPFAGVEVRIVDEAGHSASAYSGSDGAFFIKSDASNGVTFPAHVAVRDATNERIMITTITSTMTSCGASNCHVPGGKPPNDYYPIHLP